MPDPSKSAPPTVAAVPTPASSGGSCAPGSAADKMICERCGKAEMFRMHAVWRCPTCGYKTDCCGW